MLQSDFYSIAVILASMQLPAMTEPICPICLGPLGGENGGEHVWRWRCLHGSHLDCVLAQSSSRLPCPICRCEWRVGVDSENFIMAMSARHRLLSQPTATHNDQIMAQPPRNDPPAEEQTSQEAPSFLLPLCCPRMAMRDPGDFVDLPDRRMHWFANSNGSRWTREWMCLRCATCYDESNINVVMPTNRPTCARHGPRTLLVDLRFGTREWVCSIQTRFDVPHIDALCSPEEVPDIVDITADEDVSELCGLLASIQDRGDMVDDNMMMERALNLNEEVIMMEDIAMRAEELP